VPGRVVRLKLYQRERLPVKVHKGFEEKSRLGRLLINRGYISEGQLEAGPSFIDRVPFSYF